MHLDLHKIVHNVFPHNKKVMEFYVSHLLKVAGMAMIAVFAPLYVLSLGFSLSIVMVTFLLHSVSQMVFVFAAAKFCGRYGVKKSAIIGMLFLMLYYVMMLKLPTASALVFAIPIVYGISSSFYYLPLNAVFSKGLDGGRVGKEYGTFASLIRVSAVLGPVIGGIIIAFTGFQTPFLIALAFLLVALIPLLRSKDFKLKSHCSLKKEIAKTDFRHLFGFVGWGITMRSVSLWHIFVFMLFGSYVIVGGIGTLGLAMGIIGTFLAGLAYDRIGLRWLFPLNTIWGSLLSIARAFVSTVSYVIGLEFLLAPSIIFNSVAVQSQFYKASKRSGDVMPYSLLRELMIHGGIAFYSALFAIVFYFTPKIELAFIFAGLTHLLMLVMIRKKPLRL